MELRHLRYFTAVAEELNFSRAAERLHMAQPPLSTQIRALEEELGAPLFERDRRRVYLTPAGRLFLERARGILALAEEARGEVRSAAAGETGHLALGYTATAMFSPVLPLAIRRFRQAHPRVAVTVSELSSVDQLDALHNRELDLGILRKPDALVPTGICIDEWRSAPLVVAMPDDHPLAARASVRMQDLQAEAFVVYPRDAGIGLYWKVIDLCARAGFRPRIAREARESSSIVGLVAAGVGVAVVPADMHYIALPGVKFQKLADKQAVSTLHLAWREEADGAAVNPHLAGLLARLKAPGKGTRRARSHPPE